MASQFEQDFEQYLRGVVLAATKEELISAAKSNDAPRHLIEHLEGLRDGAEYTVSINYRRPRARASKAKAGAEAP